MVADFNRLRWVLHALGENEALTTGLQESVSQGKPAQLVDSISLLKRKLVPARNAHVILWDGYESHRELQQGMPALLEREDIRYAVVGRISDLNHHYRRKPIPLFPLAEPNNPGLANGNVIAAPMLSVATIRFRTKFRACKNALADRRRHTKLTGTPLVVYCGLIRPTRPALAALTRGAIVPSLTTELEGLASIQFGHATTGERSHIAMAFGHLGQSPLASPEEIAAAYAAASILHRIAVVDMLVKNAVPFFLSEYGRDRHIDPYDSSSYGQHLYLDFGSTRGPDARYPRAADIAATGKQCVALRFLGESDSFVSFLRSTDSAAFTLLCEQHAHQVMAAFAKQTLAAPGNLQRGLP